MRIINIGATANDGTGDQVRDAFDKCNDNFAELVAAITGAESVPIVFEDLVTIQSDINAAQADIAGLQADLDIAESGLNTAQADIIGLQTDLNAAESDLTTVQADVAALQTGQSSGVIGYATQALLYADLAHDAGKIGYVTNDTVVANNGTYRKIGASGAGSWEQSNYDRVALLEAQAAIPDATGNLLGLHTEATIFEHSRGEAEMTGAVTYSNLALGWYQYCAKAIGFTALEIYFNTTTTGASELRVYEVDFNPATCSIPFDLSALTPVTVNLVPANVYAAAPAKHTVTFGEKVAIAAGKYLVVVVIATVSGNVTAPRLDFSETDRLPLLYNATARGVANMTRGSYGSTYNQTALRLIYHDPVLDAIDARVTVLEDATIYDAGGEIRTGTIPFEQWVPPLGDSEMAGNASYPSATIAGCYETLAKISTFNAVQLRIWCADQTTDIFWRCWIRPSAAAFNTSTITPDDSGTIAAGSFPSENNLYTHRLNKSLIAAAGTTVFLLFHADNDAMILFRYWAGEGVMEGRHSMVYSDRTDWPAVTWPDILAFGTSGNYDQAGIKLLNESPEIRTLTALTASNAPRIILPDEIVGVVGDTLQLFNRGFIEHPDPDGQQVDITCTIGAAYPRYFQVTPVAGDAGTKALTVEVKDLSCQVLTSRAINLLVVNPTGQPAAGKNVLCMGDSLTVAGLWPSELQRRLCGTGGSPAGKNYGNITFIGTCGSGAQRWEGYGGWAYATYLGEGLLAYWTTIASHDKDATDQKSIYVDGSSHQWTMETIEAGRIKWLATGHSSAMPASGTLTWVSGGVHHTAITFSASASEPGTPFWNAGTEEIDFANYCTVNGFAGIDIVYILLGWNSLGSANLYQASDHAAVMANARTLIDAVIASYPSAEIRLMGLQPPSPLGGLGANYGANYAFSHYYRTLRSVNGYNLALQSLANEAAYSAFTKYLAVAPQFDADYNSQWTATAVNTRNAATERRGTNGVHPDTPGQYQIADVAYRDFIRSFCS